MKNDTLRVLVVLGALFVLASASANASSCSLASTAGNSGVEDTSGTITVNKNCTAIATTNVFVNGQLQRTAVLAGVFDSNENHLRVIFQSLTLPDGTNVPVVLTLDASRISFQED